MKYESYDEKKGRPLLFGSDDISALAFAIKLKDTLVKRISVVCMGPLHVEEALKDVMCYGANDVYLVSDQLFTGSDTLITTYILSNFVRYLSKHDKIDIILCGKNSSDGGTGQVGPGLAYRINYSFVSDINYLCIDNNEFIARNKECEIKTKNNILATVGDVFYLPFPSLNSFFYARKKNIEIISNVDLKLEKSKVGLLASPTKLIKVEDNSDIKFQYNKIIDESLEESVNNLINIIKKSDETFYG